MSDRLERKGSYVEVVVMIVVLVATSVLCKVEVATVLHDVIVGHTQVFVFVQVKVAGSSPRFCMRAPPRRTLPSASMRSFFTAHRRMTSRLSAGEDGSAVALLEVFDDNEAVGALAVVGIETVPTVGVIKHLGSG